MGNFIDYDNSNIYIYYIDMPYSVRSNIVENNDGTYTLYLNNRLSYEDNLEGYKHELDHINYDDFNCDDDIQTIELNRHEVVDE